LLVGVPVSQPSGAEDLDRLRVDVSPDLLFIDVELAADLRPFSGSDRGLPTSRCKTSTKRVPTGTSRCLG